MKSSIPRSCSAIISNALGGASCEHVICWQCRSNRIVNISIILDMDQRFAGCGLAGPWTQIDLIPVQLNSLMTRRSSKAMPPQGSSIKSAKAILSSRPIHCGRKLRKQVSHPSKAGNGGGEAKSQATQPNPLPAQAISTPRRPSFSSLPSSSTFPFRTQPNA